MKMAVFWVVAPCRLAGVYRCFKGTSCLYRQGDAYSSLVALYCCFLLIYLTTVCNCIGYMMMTVMGDELEGFWKEITPVNLRCYHNIFLGN
jgi:hypothetical protein